MAAECNLPLWAVTLFLAALVFSKVLSFFFYFYQIIPDLHLFSQTNIQSAAGDETTISRSSEAMWRSKAQSNLSWLVAAFSLLWLPSGPAGICLRPRESAFRISVQLGNIDLLKSFPVTRSTRNQTAQTHLTQELTQCAADLGLLL